MKRLAEQSLYEILEIHRDAPPDEVEKAYERAKALYSPGSLVTYTLMDPEEAELLSRRIEEARAVLLDPVMRSSYDAGLPPEPERDGRPARLPPVIPPVKAPAPQPERVSTPEPRALVSTTASTEGSQPAPAVAAVTPPQTPAVSEPAPDGAGAPAGEPAGSRATGASAAAAEAPLQAARSEPSRSAPHSPHTSYSIPDGGPWTGEALRRVREARGMTLHQIAERTKVTRHHLENIEADRYARLPAAVYLRGILMSLAKELRLDGQKVARSYLEQMAAPRAQPSQPSKGR